ncbi:MAG: hypothetical protein M1820_003039 [Bogoriella megaspora]|nr:MAG: hypothetical protein M1820_003039 [Bogoriella megaspora]
MPRGRPRKSEIPTTTTATISSRKRQSQPKLTPTRQSKRAKRATITPTAKVTPTKSQHFAKTGDDESDREDDVSEPESRITNEESGYEDEDESAVPSPSESEEDIEDEYSESDEVKPVKKGRSKPSEKDVSTVPIRGSKAKELWRPGIKAGLGPGQQVIIKKPKAREAGSTPYRDDSIHPNTLLFLRDLKANNDREWLKMNDPEFRQAERDFKSFAEALSTKITELDGTVPELPFKDIVFRIYRDIRFTSDPTPYKTHFSAAWSRTGRKGPYAAYYVQIAPGNSFVGGGLWLPSAEPLAALRRDIDQRPHRIKTVLTEEGLRKDFLGGIGKDDKKATRAFAAQNSNNALKTKPKKPLLHMHHGFSADHPNIELLKLRNFTVGRKLSDDEVILSTGLEKSTLVSCIQSLVSWITYLNEVVMPDNPPSSDSSEDEEEEEEDDNAEEASESTVEEASD